MCKTRVRHDYTDGTRENGWAIMDFAFLDAGNVKIAAFGLKRDGTLEPGEEIVISMPDGDVLYEITKIRYRQEPHDMYEAELKYIQHLTGLRIMGQNEGRQHARQLEWSQRLEQRRNERTT